MTMKFIVAVFILNCTLSIKVRYIHVKQLSNKIKPLNLAQIEVFNSQGNNIAKEKPVYLSSTYNKYEGLICTNGLANSFCHTQKEVGAWMELDLEQVYEDILKIRIINRKDMYKDWIVPGRVFLFDDDYKLVDTYLIDKQYDYYDFETQYSKDIHINNKNCSLGNKYNRINKIRYVKIQNEDIELTALNILEIEIILFNGSNVALGKYVNASSIYDTRYHPQNMTDGDFHSLGHTEFFSLEEWVIVDLGSEYSNIERIKITNRQDCCDYRLNEAYLYLFDSNMNLLEHIPIRGIKPLYQYYPSCQRNDILMDL